MKPILLISLLLVPFLTSAQELGIRQGWSLSAGVGFDASMSSIGDASAHEGCVSVSIDKQITSVFAFALKADYHYGRTSLIPCLRTDMVNLFTGKGYRHYPWSATVDLGMGWGYYDTDAATDHHYNMYLTGATARYRLNPHLSFDVALQCLWRTYAEHCGMSSSRATAHILFGFSWLL